MSPHSTTSLSVPRGSRWKHRLLARLLLGPLIALAIGGCASEPPREGVAPDSPKSPPDVLLIVIDDLNDWISPLGGHPQAKTPNLDRLARRGTVFTRAYTPAPLCNPARSAILTGLRPSRSGIYDNRQPLRSVSPGVETLPQYFRRHGYSTTAAGKIFHDPDPDSWQESLPKVPPAAGPERSGPRLAGAEATFDWASLDIAPEAMPDQRLADWLVERLRRPRQGPRFFALGLTSPHLPWNLPRGVFEALPEEIELPAHRADDLEDVPDVGQLIARRRGEHEAVLEAGAWQEAVGAYLASISFADAVVGTVLDALEASPHGENTIIAVFSDHGFHLGEKEHWRKGTLWEESAHVPLILSGPGVEAGRCHRTVDLQDLFPTLLDLTGLPPKAGVDGRSLVPLLRAPQTPWPHPAVTEKRRDLSIRDERYRYILYRDGSEELYDHDSDPEEWHNLASDPGHDATKERLASHLPTHRAPPAPWAEGRQAEED